MDVVGFAIRAYSITRKTAYWNVELAGSGLWSFKYLVASSSQIKSRALFTFLQKCWLKNVLNICMQINYKKYSLYIFKNKRYSPEPPRTIRNATQKTRATQSSTSRPAFVICLGIWWVAHFKTGFMMRLTSVAIDTRLGLLWFAPCKRL